MFHALQPMALAAAGVMAVATLAGAWLARRWRRRRELWFAVPGVLLVIAGMHLLPDAWSAAREAGIWPWAVPAAAAVSFTLAGLIARAGCACEADEQHATGAGTAAALTAHRFLEGSVLALTGSAAVAAALAVHALGEGLAVGTLLAARPRRQLTVWLAAICAGPVIGAVATAAYRLPTLAAPLLLASAVGILAQAARISLRTAFRDLRPGGRLLSRGTATFTLAAAVTALAVLAIG